MFTSLADRDGDGHTTDLTLPGDEDAVFGLDIGLGVGAGIPDATPADVSVIVGNWRPDLEAIRDYSFDAEHLHAHANWVDGHRLVISFGSQSDTHLQRGEWVARSILESTVTTPLAWRAAVLSVALGVEQDLGPEAYTRYCK